LTVVPHSLVYFVPVVFVQYILGQVTTLLNPMQRKRKGPFIQSQYRGIPLECLQNSRN